MYLFGVIFFRYGCCFYAQVVVCSVPQHFHSVGHLYRIADVYERIPELSVGDGTCVFKSRLVIRVIFGYAGVCRRRIVCVKWRRIQRISVVILYGDDKAFFSQAFGQAEPFRQRRFRSCRQSAARRVLSACRCALYLAQKEICIYLFWLSCSASVYGYLTQRAFPEKAACRRHGECPCKLYTYHGENIGQ